MTRENFLKNYYRIAERALKCVETARREGLLALEDIIDKEKVNERDIFEYGLYLIVDGYDHSFIERILSNLINQETYEDPRTLKMIQKEAVLGIQEGVNPHILYLLMNSYTDLPLDEDEMRHFGEIKGGCPNT
jgi:flagellar motor component MotA